MTFKKCGVCKALHRTDSQCHNCGAYFVVELGYHIDVANGRRLDSALRTSINTNPKISYSRSVAIASAVARKARR